VSTPSIADRLAATTPPWVHLLVAADDPPALPAPPQGFVARTLDGSRCRTKRALLEELGRTLEFPPHFGRTWDALEDCLTDLDWLPGAGYRLVVRAADRLLARDEASYATFVALLADVGRAWGTARTGHPDRSPVAFHTVLLVPRERVGARRSWGAPRLAS
jgi:hypothetical protein